MQFGQSVLSTVMVREPLKQGVWRCARKTSRIAIYWQSEGEASHTNHIYLNQMMWGCNGLNVRYVRAFRLMRSRGCSQDILNMAGCQNYLWVSLLFWLRMYYVVSEALFTSSPSFFYSYSGLFLYSSWASFGRLLSSHNPLYAWQASSPNLTRLTTSHWFTHTHFHFTELQWNMWLRSLLVTGANVFTPSVPGFKQRNFCYVSISIFVEQ